MESRKMPKTSVYFVSFFFSIYSQFYAYIWRRRSDKYNIGALNINMLLSVSLFFFSLSPSLGVCKCYLSCQMFQNFFLLLRILGMPSLLHCHRRYFQQISFPFLFSLFNKEVLFIIIKFQSHLLTAQ